MTAYMYYIQNSGFTANDASFIRTKLASYMTHYNFNESSMLLLKLLEEVLLYFFMGFLPTSQKKNIN